MSKSGERARIEAAMQSLHPEGKGPRGMTQGTDTAAPAPIPIAGNVYAVISMVVWAAGFPAAELLLDTWDPLAMVLGRFLFALALLLPLWMLAGGLSGARDLPWWRGLLVGGVGFGGGAWTMLMAQWFTDPVTTAIIAATTPLAATLIAWWYDREPLRGSFILGLAATLLGGLVATGVLTGSDIPTRLGPGALMAVGSALLFSWGSYHIVRDMPQADALTRTTLSTLGGLVFIAAAFALFLPFGLTALPPLPPTPADLGLMAIYGILGFGISQLAWIAAAGHLGVAVAAFHINIAPFYVMLILLAMGGSWSWPQAIGAAIVAAGVILAQRRPPPAQGHAR
jgi:drug/metabolite transporter (DMT)-like permease